MGMRNFVRATLDSQFSVSDTIAQLTAGHGDMFDNPGASGKRQYNCVVWDPNDNIDPAVASHEIFRVSAKSGDQLTALARHRGMEGTTAATWPAGSVVALSATVDNVRNVVDYDPKAYGADATGATNSQQAFDDLIGDILAGDAGRVVIGPNDHFTINNFIFPNDRFLELRGIGPARPDSMLTARLTQDDAQSGDFVQISSLPDTSSYFAHHVYGLVLQGGAAGRHVMSIIERVRNCRVENMWFRAHPNNTIGSGFYCDEGYYLSFRHIWCGGVGGRYGLQFFNASNVRVNGVANFGSGGAGNNVSRYYFFAHGGREGSAVASGTQVTVTVTGHPYSAGETVVLYEAYDTTDESIHRTEYEGTWTIDSVNGDDFVVTVTSAPGGPANLITYRPVNSSFDDDLRGGNCDFRNIKGNAPGDEGFFHARNLVDSVFDNCNGENSSGVTPTNFGLLEDSKYLAWLRGGGDEPDPTQSGKDTLLLKNAWGCYVRGGQFRGKLRIGSASRDNIIEQVRFEGEGDLVEDSALCRTIVRGAQWNNKGNRPFYPAGTVRYLFKIDDLAQNLTNADVPAYPALPAGTNYRAPGPGAVVAMCVSGSGDFSAGQSATFRPKGKEPQIVVTDAADNHQQVYVTLSNGGQYAKNEAIEVTVTTSATLSPNTTRDFIVEVFVMYFGVAALPQG